MSREIEVNIGVHPSKDLACFKDDFIGEEIGSTESGYLLDYLIGEGVIKTTQEVVFVIRHKHRIDLGENTVYTDGELNEDEIIEVSVGNFRKQLSLMLGDEN